MALPAPSMTSSRTLVFLVLIGLYGLLLLSLTAAAQPAYPGAALSTGAVAAPADPAVQPTLRYPIVETEGLGFHLLETGYVARKESGAVGTRLLGDLPASHVPTGN